MYIHTVWVQRKCSYADQFLPELVAAIDSGGHNNNPDYIHGELEKHKNQADIVSARYIALNLRDLTWEKVQKILSTDLIVVASSTDVLG